MELPIMILPLSRPLFSNMYCTTPIFSSPWSLLTLEGKPNSCTPLMKSCNTVSARLLSVMVAYNNPCVPINTAVHNKPVPGKLVVTVYVPQRIWCWNRVLPTINWSIPAKCCPKQVLSTKAVANLPSLGSKSPCSESSKQSSLSTVWSNTSNFLDSVFKLRIWKEGYIIYAKCDFGEPVCHTLGQSILRSILPDTISCFQCWTFFLHVNPSPNTLSMHLQNELKTY